MDSEDGSPSLSMIKVPQIIEIGGRYVSSQERHEEAIKRHLTVIVSRNVAIECQLPFVCHNMDEYTRSNPLDKSANPTPYTSLLGEDEVVAYYNTASDLEEMVDRDSLSPEKQKQYDELNQLDREVWRNHVSENEYRKRVARETKIANKEKAAVACRIEKANIQFMTSNEIFRYLSHHIRNHEKNLLEIAHVLSQVNQPIQEATDQFLKMVFCGSSGIGKTDLIRHIALLCGVQRGGEYEKCHISLDFATCLEKGHANIITGPGPGYIGCEEPCLVDRLIDAKDFIQEMEQREEMNEDEKNGRYKKRQRPKIILLEINEMDKGTLNLFTALNGFLNNGCISSHRDRHFVLPPDVFIIMCACSNFADDYFKSLPDATYRAHNRTEASIKIKESMASNGLKEWDIVRLGTVMPFFPINKNDTREIVRFKLREVIAQRGLYVEHIRMSLSMSDDSQDCFVDHLMDNMYTSTGGIRGIIYTMKRQLAFNLTTQREFIEKYIDASVPVPLAKRPMLVFQCVYYENILKANKKQNVTMAALNKDFYLKVRDRSHGMNESNLADCLAIKCDIAYFVLDCDNVIKKKDTLGIHVLAPIPKSTEEVHLSQQMLLKRKIDEDDDDDDDDDDAPTKKKPKKKSLSIEEEEEEEEKQPIQWYDNSKDDIIVTEEECEETTNDNTEDSRPGRPRKSIEGFTYYDTKNKRSRYRCDNRDCRAILEGRRTDKHACKTK